MTKILLVEDDKSLREIYGVRLLAEGYDIVSAGDGEEALAMAIKERPELIISDVMMPKISGFDMLDILRSTTETKDIKVIMMTALSSEDQRARGQALGADRYLVKSQVGIEDVVRTVHEVLKDAPVTMPGVPAAPRSGVVPSVASTPRQTPSTPPTRPSAPVYNPTPSPHAVPQPQTPPSTLPQPTAPFSTTRPANLGERVIHPIGGNTSGNSNNGNDLANRMNQELERAEMPAAPTPPVSPPSIPMAPPPPAPATLPTPPVAQPVNQGMPAPQPTPPQPAASALPQTPASQTPPEPAFSPKPAISNEGPGIDFEEIPRPPAPTPPSTPS